MCIRDSLLLALGQEPLELADLDRLRLVGAHALALQLLGAHASGHVRQRVALLQQRQPLGELALAQQLQQRRDVDLHRAAALAMPGRQQLPQLARALGALLVAQRLQPHEPVSYTHLDVYKRQVEQQ